MNKEDLENILKFADNNNLLWKPFETVYKIWKNSKQ